METRHPNITPSDSCHPPPTSARSAAVRVSPFAETVLVVDDDPMVRDVEAQILRLNGYTVFEAESAAEALRMAGEPAPIHLLITDLSMPEIDGLELTRRFRTMRPETPMLMVSGSLPLLRDRIQELDQFEFMAKPFAFSDLLHKVRTILDATNPVSQDR